MPFILIGVFGAAAIEKMRLERLFPYTDCSNSCKKYTLRFIYLPWYLILIAVMLVTFLIAGISCMLVTLLPAWFYNVRRFRRMQLYWKGKYMHSKKKEPIASAPLLIRPTEAPHNPRNTDDSLFQPYQMLENN